MKEFGLGRCSSRKCPWPSPTPRAVFQVTLSWPRLTANNKPIEYHFNFCKGCYDKIWFNPPMSDDEGDLFPLEDLTPESCGVKVSAWQNA